MAKGKHSTALFEVIHSNKQPERMAQALRTPKWWFKGRPAGDGASLNDPVNDSTEADPTAPAPAPRPASSPSTRRYEPRSSAIHFEFDRERHEITLRLRYTTAIISAFTVLVVIGMSYVVGRRLSSGPQTASAAMEQPVLNPQPQHRDLIRPRTSRTTTPSPLTTEPPRHQPEPPAGTNTQPPQIDPPPSPKNSNLAHGLPRRAPYNYVIIQSYPPEEAKTAEQARDFLNKNGVPCTTQELPGYARSGWLCVIGTDGFTKTTSSPEYQNYVTHIRQLSEKFPKARFFRFDPQPYRWRE